MTDRPLPETIPEPAWGEPYVLLLSQPTGARPAATVGHQFGDWVLTVAEVGSAILTEAQARHLLAMPGRPHDDRLDGPEDRPGRRTARPRQPRGRPMSDPYADLRRALDVWDAQPEHPHASVVQGGHTSVSGWHHTGPGVECPVPWCAYHYAANPDTIARLLAERDALAADRPNLVALLAELVDFMGEPCRYDHNDRCQAHMLHAADECPVAQAAAILLREDHP